MNSIIGSKLTIVKGPFSGYGCLVISDDGNKYKVEIEIIGKKNVIEINKSELDLSSTAIETNYPEGSFDFNQDICMDYSKTLSQEKNDYFNTALDDFEREYAKEFSNIVLKNKNAFILKFLAENGWEVIRELVLREYIHYNKNNAKPNIKKDDCKVFLLSDAPDNFPWKFATNDVEKIIDANFATIQKKSPLFFNTLKKQTIAVLGMTNNLDHFTRDSLLYIGYNYFYYVDYKDIAILAGGRPNVDPKPNEKLVKQGWAIPDDIKDFYRIHDGFGLLTFDYSLWNVIKPAGRLESMERMNQCAKELNEIVDYDFNNIVEFYTDGSGNGQNFVRKSPADSNPLTRWRDHETWDLGNELTFWEFLDKGQAMQDWFGSGY